MTRFGAAQPGETWPDQPTDRAGRAGHETRCRQALKLGGAEQAARTRVSPGMPERARGRATRRPRRRASNRWTCFLLEQARAPANPAVVQHEVHRPPSPGAAGRDPPRRPRPPWAGLGRAPHGGCVGRDGRSFPAAHVGVEPTMTRVCGRSPRRPPGVRPARSRPGGKSEGRSGSPVGRGRPRWISRSGGWHGAGLLSGGLDCGRLFD